MDASLHMFSEDPSVDPDGTLEKAIYELPGGTKNVSVTHRKQHIENKKASQAAGGGKHYEALPINLVTLKVGT